MKGKRGATAKDGGRPGIARFRVRPGREVELAHWATRVPDFYADEKDAERQLARQVALTSDLQELLYASDRYSLLLIFQAMDAAGKDGAIKHVLSGVNPQGIFNRSYYEEVLVVRVHPEYLAGQRLPDKPLPGSPGFWARRMHSIREHEAHLVRNGTIIVKFFLHVSQEEQRRRFLDRIDHPDKNWKFSESDVRERQHWDAYMAAYAQALSATSTREAPWYVIPADDKKNARLIMSTVINQTLQKLKLEFPKLDRGRLTELKAARRLLAK
jgi:polyphosphate kinase 2 (PPK2 family)